MPSEQDLFQLAQNVARLEARFDGVEREIKQLRMDLKESMGTIQRTLQELALFNERLVHNANEHTHIHGRIDEHEERLDEIEETLDEVTTRLESHCGDHCEACAGEGRLHSLENKVGKFDGILDVYRFMKSRWGIALLLVLFVDVLVDMWAHHDLLKKLYDVLTLQ